MKQIEAVIFDWAGTTIDYGCMAPVHAMKEAFLQKNLPITFEQIRKPMGMLKHDHIKTIFEMDAVQDDFKNKYGRVYQAKDVEEVYQEFEKNIFSTLHQHTKMIEGVLLLQNQLREKNIKIGSTTGYTKAMMEIVVPQANHQGYAPDYIISSDQVPKGRPYPYMLHQNAAHLGLLDMRRVIKVGDTIVDILEGLYAGCWSVGVVKGSSLLGLDEDEIKKIDSTALNEKVRKARFDMFAAGADYVIDSIDELPFVIEVIQKKMNS